MARCRSRQPPQRRGPSALGALEADHDVGELVRSGLREKLLAVPELKRPTTDEIATRSERFAPNISGLIRVLNQVLQRPRESDAQRVQAPQSPIVRTSSAVAFRNSDQRTK